MNDEPDNDLHSIFAQQRRCDHENAPAWRPKLLDRPIQRSQLPIRWITTSAATACVALLAMFLAHLPSTSVKLSELPPLFDAPPAELFAGVDSPLLSFEAPSDFLLPEHLNLHIP